MNLQNKTLFLIGRAGGSYGIGHLMRLRALAEKWQERGLAIILLEEPLPDLLPIGFALAGEKAHELLCNHIYESGQSETTGKKVKVYALEKFLKLIFEKNKTAKSKLPICLVDGRNHTQADVKKLQKFFNKVVLLDDYGSARTEASLCIDSLTYPRGLVMPKPKRLLQGLEYMVIPNIRTPVKTGKSKGGGTPSVLAFSKWQKRPIDLLIILGALDPFNLEAKLLSLLKRWSGQGNKKEGEPDRDTLRIACFVGESGNFKILAKHDNIRIYHYKKNFHDLSRLLAESKILLTYFGMTLFEGWHKGAVPLLFAPSPYHAALSLSLGKEFPEVLFPKDCNGKGAGENLASTFHWCLANYFAKGDIALMGEKLQKIQHPPFDEKGASRIALEMERLMGNPEI